jgi:transposase
MIQLALADLESGKYTSIRQAAKAYHVSRSTLANRQHGMSTRSVAYEQQQRLTPA